MHTFPDGKLPYLLSLLEQAGGNYPITDNIYHGLAKVVRTYPRGRRVLTPDGEQKLVLGVDVGIKWIDEVLQNHMREVGVAALLGMLKRHQYPESQTKSEMIRLMEINREAQERVVPFYLTSSGSIFYKVPRPDPSWASPSAPNSVYMFRVSEEEIPAAEQVLRTVRVVNYFPDWVVADLIPLPKDLNMCM